MLLGGGCVAVAGLFLVKRAALQEEEAEVCATAACGYNHTIGTVEVDGMVYNSALIVEHRDDGVHVVGGFVSDSPLGTVTVGEDHPDGAELKIVPSEGVVFHRGKRLVVNGNGRLVWLLKGKVYEQELKGFPLETELKVPAEARGAPTARAE
jgi:hypothetical protein